MAIPLEATTFQDDVRREWIQAVFGTDFPHKGGEDTDIDFDRSNSENTMNNIRISAWKGVGLARIPFYTTYSVEIPPIQLPLHDNDEKKEALSSQSPLETTETTTHHKLGITLSRLTLGLYVRHVHPGSEAWCAGVQPKSVLVGINHGTINLLAEPTKAALERIWQYEGFAKDSAQISSAMIIREPISMTFILHGRLYDVIFFSNPPYGIDWAPCGDFCLVKRVTSQQAKISGIQPSSIIAGITAVEDQATQNIYSLDHVSAAEALKRAVASNNTIQVQFCAPPSRARSGHWERSQDAASKQGEIKHNVKTVSWSSSERNATSSPERTTFTRELDGIQVRIHSILGQSGGVLRRSLSTPNFREPSLVSLSHLAAKVATGDPFPLKLTSYKNKTWRHGNDAKAQNEMDGVEGTRRHSVATQHGRPRNRSNYRPCPRLEKSILECWDHDQALIYLCRHHLVDYNERTVLFLASEDHHVIEMLQGDSSIMKVVSSELATRFLLFWMARLTFNYDQHSSLSQWIMDLAQQNVLSLAYPMEYLSWAFESQSSGESLSKLRIYRSKVAQRPQVLRHQCRVSMFSKGGDSMTRSQLATDEDGKSSALEIVESNKGSAVTFKDALGCDKEQNGNNSTDCSDKAKPKRRFRLFRKKKTSSRSTSQPKPSLDATSCEAAPVASDKSSVEQLHRNEHRESAGTVRVMAATNENAVACLPRTQQNISFLDSIFPHLLSFIRELEIICQSIEESLMQSFSKKFARWALSPWTSSKETALAQVTHTMRERLKICNQTSSLVPLLNPVNSKELLVSIDTSECYVLPSAHFPLLLTFDSQKETSLDCRHCRMDGDQLLSSLSNHASDFAGEEKRYRVTVELVQLKGPPPNKEEKLRPHKFKVLGSVAGVVVESGVRTVFERESNHNDAWKIGNILVFDSRSSWGAPKTLTLRLDYTDENLECKNVGYCWIDLSSFWENLDCYQSGNYCPVRVNATVVSPTYLNCFDEHGQPIDSDFETISTNIEHTELEIGIMPEVLDIGGISRKSLLYKHDDDVRQEMFAIQFMQSCDRILRASGLDMKMLFYRSIAVGKRQGFIEWVDGSVPLSEICQQTFTGKILGKKGNDRDKEVSSHDSGCTDSDDVTLSSVAKAGLAKYQLLRPTNPECELKPMPTTSLIPPINPIQDFFRSCAYDAEAPYNIKRAVMDTYVKSCAGYSVCTFVLGVGDRHLDNLLLRQSGHFFHCDYSFILGNDPKKHLPMRITEEMVNGMGGWKSDKFCQFLSLCCAVYLTLRRPENVRHLLSLVRVMEGSNLPDLELNQSLEAAMEGVRNRLHLDFTDDEAITFMEKQIEQSCSSKMWMAVDAIHSLAQRF